MMAARLPDEVRLSRLRESVRNASARRRVKLTMDGKTQLLCWIPATLRAQLDGLAAQQNQNLSDATAALLIDGLAYRRALANPATPLPPANTLPLFDAPPAPVEDAPAPVDRDSRILALKREQPELSNYAIAAQVGCSEATARRVINRAKQEESAP
jgi:hypothetical protein